MELAVFITTAVIAVVGAAAMLISRNGVHSALFLLINFGAIAVLYLLLQAPFLFAVQLIVYAGAIIVLFLFVVMLLGAERAEDERDRIAWQRPLALVLGFVLLVQAVWVLVGRQVPLVSAPAAPPAGFGNPEQIGVSLFTDYLLPFEVTAIILLVALVGVAVLNTRERGR